eukprot:g58600.t1
MHEAKKNLKKILAALLGSKVEISSAEPALTPTTTTPLTTSAWSPLNQTWCLLFLTSISRSRACESVRLASIADNSKLANKMLTALKETKARRRTVLLASTRLAFSRLLVERKQRVYLACYSQANDNGSLAEYLTDHEVAKEAWPKLFELMQRYARLFCQRAPSSEPLRLFGRWDTLHVAVYRCRVRGRELVELIDNKNSCDCALAPLIRMLSDSVVGEFWEALLRQAGNLAAMLGIASEHWLKQLTLIGALANQPGRARSTPGAVLKVIWKNQKLGGFVERR